MRKVLTLIALVFGVVSSTGAFAQSGSEAAAAMANAAQSLSQELRVRAGCHLGNTPKVGIWPLDPDTLPISEDNAVAIYGDVLAELLKSKPDCTTFLDGAGASDTLDYLNRTRAFQLLGTAPRDEIDAAFREVDFIVALNIYDQGGTVKASLKLTEPNGQTIAAPPAFDVPEAYLRASCGAGAVPLKTALHRAAETLADAAPDMRVLVNDGGFFADTDKQTEFSGYAGPLLVDELVRVVADPLSGRHLRVADASAAGDAETYRLQFRFWPCDGTDRLVMTAKLTSGQGAMSTWRGAVRTDDVPGSVSIEPEPEVNEVWSLSVTPARANVGEELSVVAEVPARCDAVFVDFSATGKAMVVPKDLFASEPGPDGGLRFRVDATTRYGLTIEPTDEKGRHYLGYFCTLPTDSAMKGTLREVWLELAAGTSRQVGVQGQRDFWFESYLVK